MSNIELFASCALVGLVSGCGAEAAGDAPPVTTYAVTVQVATPTALPPCSAAEAGNTAHVDSNDKIYLCQNATWSPIDCTKSVGGAVAYSGEDNTLWTCLHGAWVQATGANGATGATGATGGTGATGRTGATGGTGAAGSGQTSPIAFSGDELLPTGTDLTAGYGSDGSIYRNSAVNAAFTLPIHIPQGATLTSIDLYTIDNDAANMDFILNRVNIGTSPSVDLIGSVSTSSSSASVHHITLTPSPALVIDNHTATYQLIAGFETAGATLQLVGGRVNFTGP